MTDGQTDPAVEDEEGIPVGFLDLLDRSLHGDRIGGYANARALAGRTRSGKPLWLRGHRP
jgi:hypothetical protein